MSNIYVPIWFSEGDVYTFSDKDGNTIQYTEVEASRQPAISSLLKTESDVERADDDVRYAISASLLEELYGYVIS